MTNEVLLLLVLLLPFAASIAAGMLPHNARNAEAWLAGTVALTGLTLTLTFYPEMSAGQVVRMKVMDASK